MRMGSRFFLMVWILAAMTVVVACGGGDDAGGQLPPTYNLSGIWNVTATTGSNSCGDAVGISDSFIAAIVHPDGSNSMTMADIASSETVTLTVSGKSITYSGNTITPGCPDGLSEWWSFTAQTGSFIEGTVNWMCKYPGGSCNGSDSVVATQQESQPTVPGPTPLITGFTPTSGAAGATVRITGTNFSTTPADITVKFYNNVTALVTSSTSTSIMTTVPVGATTGPISVTVNGLTATSAASFTVSGGVDVGVGTAEIEPNDTFDTAQAVSSSATVIGTTSGSHLTSTYDDDWYKFTVSTAKSYTITLTFGTTLDADLHLYDSSNIRITQSISMGTGTPESVTSTLTPGTYYIFIDPWAATGTESYTLTIR